MNIIVGLGNPGAKYHNTRHNAGVLFVDFLLSHINAQMPGSQQAWKLSQKLQAQVVVFNSVTNRPYNNLILAKPLTYMNESGSVVKNLILKYKLKDLNDLYLVHDDIDISLGEYKQQVDRSAAGHNGVQSVIDHLQSQDFRRIRIGIFPTDIEKKYLDTSRFVLKKFTRSELSTLHENVFPEIKKEISLKRPSHARQSAGK